MTAFDQMLRARLDPIPTDWPPTALRHAAVLCPLTHEAGCDQLLFALRPPTLRQHAGQIGFPGGMRADYEDPVATALRECEEEIGAPADAVTLLGALPPRESSSGILVQCLVGRLASIELTLDPREVERAFYVPLADLRDESRWTDRPPPTTASGKQPPRSPHFRSGDDLIWGLTGRFVRDLVTRLR